MSKMKQAVQWLEENGYEATNENLPVYIKWRKKVEICQECEELKQSITNDMKPDEVLQRIDAIKSKISDI